MMRSTTRLPALAAALCLLLTGVPAALAEPTPPDQLVHSTADAVFAVLRADDGSDMKALAEVVDTKVVDHFDFGAMTRLAVGKHWRSADDSQRQALVEEFRTLLVRTYSVALQQFINYRIDYRPLTLEPAAKQAVVQTSVAKDGGKPIHMDYRMIARDSGWKVYDVLVDGVSLVVNYRSLFGSTVEKSGIDGLIRLLREKNADGTTG